MADKPNNKTSLLYKITNLVNGKVYIGQTSKTLNRRWAQHKHSAKSGSPYAIHGAMRKYGVENFTISELETVTGGPQNVVDAECRLITEYHSVSPLGYNLTLGGEGVDYLVPSTRQKHSIEVKSRGDSWRKKMSDVAKERSSDPNWRKAVSKRMTQYYSTPKNYEQVKMRANSARQALQEKVLERDSLRGPEELSLVLKKRESVRRCAVRRKAGVILTREQKDALLPPDELERRLRRREIQKRSREKRKHV